MNADTTDPMMRGFNNIGKYLSDQFCSVYTLEGNETKRSVSDLFSRHCHAAVMVSIMILAGLQIPNHQLGTVGESLVHIICAVSSNAHGITQPSDCETHLDDRFIPVASLLMPVLSLLNHHCDPNVVRHNYNGTIVLTAIQPIFKDSQVIILWLILNYIKIAYKIIYMVLIKIKSIKTMSIPHCKLFFLLNLFST